MIVNDLKRISLTNRKLNLTPLVCRFPQALTASKSTGENTKINFVANKPQKKEQISCSFFFSSSFLIFIF